MAPGADRSPAADLARFGGLPDALGFIGIALVVTLVDGLAEETRSTCLDACGEDNDSSVGTPLAFRRGRQGRRCSGEEQWRR